MLEGQLGGPGTFCPSVYLGWVSQSAVLYAVRVGGGFVRVRSYAEFTLVDHPAKGTLFSRRRDAEARRAKVLDWANLVHGGPNGAEVVAVRLTYEVVEG